MVTGNLMYTRERSIGIHRINALGVVWTYLSIQNLCPPTICFNGDWGCRKSVGVTEGHRDFHKCIWSLEWEGRPLQG